MTTSHHQCVVYTDHEALKSLLNTPQPSGKLAHWGVAIQELDYQLGGKNQNADAHHMNLLLLCFQVQLSRMLAN